VKYPTIYDPTTCTPAFSGSNCQPFMNNSVPSGSLDTAMQALMKLFPMPNTTTAGSPPDVNNYIRNAPLTDFEDNYDAGGLDGFAEGLGVCALQLLESQPRYSWISWGPRGRDVDVGVGQPDPEVAQRGAGVDAHREPEDGE
jgi:hypothetical protein